MTEGKLSPEPSQSSACVLKYLTAPHRLKTTSAGLERDNVWDVHGLGIKPVSPELAGIFLTTGPPGKSETDFSISEGPERKPAAAWLPRPAAGALAVEEPQMQGSREASGEHRRRCNLLPPQSSPRRCVQPFCAPHHQHGPVCKTPLPFSLSTITCSRET